MSAKFLFILYLKELIQKFSTLISIYSLIHFPYNRNNQQSLFNMLGLIFSATIFCGINNSSSVIPYITTERNVLYRERFAGMYAPWAYGLAQVTFAYIKFQQINIKTCNKLWMKFVGDN